MGYDYEQAVAAGGLEARDLFNSIMLIMSMLEEEKHRIPIKKVNLLVLVDGSRPSYVTLDTAAHLHKHGICTVTAMLAPDSTNNPDVLMYHHLPVDLRRRCLEQYCMPEHTFQVDVMMAARADEGSDLQDDIRSKMTAINSNILVLGIDNNFSGTDTLSPVAQWAAWEPGYLTVLVKSSSRLRPFAANTLPRTFQCCLKTIDDLDCLFEACLTLLNPGDHVVFCCVVDCGDPQGDSQQTRFSMGKRQRWVAGASPPVAPTNRVDWNDDILLKLTDRIDELTTRSQISGKPILYKHDKLKTVSQELCAVAFEQGVDMMMLRRGQDREVSLEVLANATCTIILCD
jgi:hypothetical protein